MTCPACFIVDGCGGIGHGAIENHCCRCIPNRVCVSLSTDTDVCASDLWVDETSILSSVEAQWISPVDGTCGRKFTGTLACGVAEIDFTIEFYRDMYTNICYMALESDALGYTYNPMGDDLRVKLALGGEENDAAVKRAECRAMDFDFPIDISGGTGTIRLRPAPYVAAIKRRPGIHCMFERVCITVFDGYEETAHHICANSETEGVTIWHFLKDDDAGKPVTITVDDHDATGDGTTTLSLVSWLNPTVDPIVEEAECPDMVAQWDLPGGAWIRIRGDKLNKCTDCKCYCECLCVLYVEDELTQARGKACRVLSYDGCSEYWEITLLGRLLRFYLQCLDCENPSTYLVLEVEEGASIVGGVAEKTVLCPDGLEAVWSVNYPGDVLGNISVACAECGEKCTLDELSITSPCCPETRVPVNLYATVTAGEPEYPAGTVIPLVKSGPDEDPCWTGAITVTVSGQPCLIRLSLACFGVGEDAHWYIAAVACSALNTSATQATLVSCDPLIITATINPGCCENSPNCSMTVEITA
jgi:hypothetical protein